MKRIYLVDSEQPERDQVSEYVRQLDELRTEFFLDLSHQLRTPVTAMKLAMDGLFSQLRDVLSPSQRNLAGISRRNIERIVALVENQLGLLQMLAGERRICRRLTDLDGLLRGLPRRPFAAADGQPDCERPIIERAAGLGKTGPLYLFTDPEHVGAVVDCFLGVGPPNAPRSIRLDYDQIERAYRLDIHVDCLGHAESTPDTVAPEPQSAPDFETRAYVAALDQLGGEVAMEKSDSRRAVRIELPRYPDYDGEKDLLGPSRMLRSNAAKRSNLRDEERAAVHFVRCDLGDYANSDFLEPVDPQCKEFMGRIHAVLTEEDVVIRGRQQGTIYLALVSRSPHELEHTVKFLRSGSDAEPRVWNPDTIVADDREIERLVRDLESV
jgi:hypothetical protein